MTLEQQLARQVRAQLRIDAVNQRFAEALENRAADGQVRHKCFVSYHSADVEAAADFVETFEGVFIPRAVGVSESLGETIGSSNIDYIRDVIRRDYLKDSTVTIVLVGACTWARKFVDWEIYASLRDTSSSKRNGLLGVQLPTGVGVAAPTRLVANLPDDKAGSDGYARYIVYPSYGSTLQKWVQDAFDARSGRSEFIKNGAALRQRNSAC